MWLVGRTYKRETEQEKNSSDKKKFGLYLTAINNALPQVDWTGGKEKSLQFKSLYLPEHSVRLWTKTSTLTNQWDNNHIITFVSQAFRCYF